MQKYQEQLKAYSRELLKLIQTYFSPLLIEMAGALGLEPRPTVLETGMLPLTPYPYIQDGILYIHSRRVCHFRHPSNGREGRNRTYNEPGPIVLTI